MTVTGTKDSIWDISIPNPEMMVPRMKINLREETRPLELFEQVIYSGKWILILDSDFVEISIIDTHSKGSIFFLANNTGAPLGDMLGWKKPLSSRSFNCNFNSLSSIGSIIYGGIEIGFVSGSKLIPKSIS